MKPLKRLSRTHTTASAVVIARALTKTRALANALALATTLALVLLAHAPSRVCLAQSPPAVPVKNDGAAEKGVGSIKGRVVDEAGAPVPGVSVNIAPRGYATTYRPQRSVTDEEGNFTITGLDPGLYALNASMPGYVTDTDPSTSRPYAYRPGDTATVRLIKGGVITGAVTDPQGEAVVGLGIRAYRVRDLDGRPVSNFGYGGEDGTDDRGVYRIYGLTPGVYVVSAGDSGRGFFNNWGAAYAGNAPTFFPSATRDTASEVTVRAGQETAGVDIRYRDEAGRRVSGRIEFPAGAQPEPSTGFNVTLLYASSGMQAGSTFGQPGEGVFSFEGVADGDYDVQATAGGPQGQTATSAPQRVSVRGADVTGLRLALAPLASVSGELKIEQATEAERASETCRQQKRSPLLPQETLVTLVADRPAPTKGQPLTRFSLAREATPDSSGAFTLRAIEPGRYRLSVRPFDDALYVRSVQLPANAAQTNAASDASKSTAATKAGATGSRPPARATNTPNAPLSADAPARESLDMRAGRQVSGVLVRLSEGAALLSGRVVPAEGSAAPNFTQLRVHLLPAERESADDPLRYFEATPDGSGAFTFKSLPPGKYLLVARPAPEPTPDAPARPAHWDADSRARLRREAESANAPVELQPCQRTSDFTLRLPK